MSPSVGLCGAIKRRAGINKPIASHGDRITGRSAGCGAAILFIRVSPMIPNFLPTDRPGAVEDGWTALS
jgi:hypothetical protein